MKQISLKRLLAKKELRKFLDELLVSMEISVTIYDIDGTSIISSGKMDSGEKYIVEMGKKIYWMGLRSRPPNKINCSISLLPVRKRIRKKGTCRRNPGKIYGDQSLL